VFFFFYQGDPKFILHFSFLSFFMIIIPKASQQMSLGIVYDIHLIGNRHEILDYWSESLSWIYKKFLFFLGSYKNGVFFGSLYRR